MTQTTKEVYLATFTNGERMLVIPKETEAWDAPISQKKKAILHELNKSFGDYIATSVLFYGYAHIEKCNRYAKHGRTKED